MLYLAQNFATLMDETRFEEAAELLAEDCEYHYSEGNYAGRKNIANIYRQLHRLSSEEFDELVYSSEVEQMDDETYRLLLTDAVRLGDKWHELHFENVLRFKDNLIVDIQHHELPGEAEAMRKFFQSARPSATA